MKFKIYNNMHALGQVFNSIAEGLLKEVPSDKFIEVETIQECDIFISHGAVVGGNVDIPFFQGQIDPSNLNQVLSDIREYEKPRIFWLDTMGPDIFSDKGKMEAAGIRECDFIISPATTHPHPNLFTDAFHFDLDVFRPVERFERQPNTVMIIHDNLINNLPLISAIMPHITKLYVTKADDLFPDAKVALKKHLDKIITLNLSYPTGLAHTASKVQFQLNTHEGIGIELMGPESGLCGAIPIYPDNEYYRDIFDDTGVLFYDPEKPKTLIEILTDTDLPAFDRGEFAKHFGAQHCLPKFWDTVYAALQKNKAS